MASTTDTATRLQAYKDAEARILYAQRMGQGDRQRQNADLAEVRTAIKQLEAQLAAENRAAAGSGGPAVILGSLNPYYTGKDCR